MTIIEAAILGIIQGITEFLPVSSSGHLVLFQKLFGINTPLIFFDTLIHFATLLAVIFYFKKELLAIIRNLGDKETQKLILLLFFATLPAVLAGFLIKDKIEAIFNSLSLTAASFLITAVILYATRFFESGQKQITGLGWPGSLLAGCFQALAILPGVSRSGSTVSAGLFLGLKRQEAFRFSFLLAIPVILGAMVLQVFELGSLAQEISLANLAGFVSALACGFLSLKVLEIIIAKGKLHYLAFYCLALALIIFLIK